MKVIIAFCIIATLFSLLFSHKAVAKRTYGIRPAVYVEIQEIQTLLADKKWQEMEDAASNLQGKSLHDYERAQVLDILGIAKYQQGIYDEAIGYYEQVIALKAHIPEGMYQRTLRTLAQLSMMADDYQAALAFCNTLLLEQQDTALYMLISQAHYQLEQFDDALAALNQGKALITDSNRKPKENWLLLENAIHHARNDYAAMLSVLQELIQLYPKSDYLLYAANVNGELGHTDKQLGLLETLYENGNLTRQSQILNLSSLYLLEGAPYKGAALLSDNIEAGTVEKTTKTMNMLANALVTAGEAEKAIDVLSRLADMEPSGELFLRLAYQHFDIANWQGAAMSALKALDSDELEKKSEAYLLLGMAELNNKRFENAQRAFVNAANYEDDKKLAQQWLNYTDSEIKKYAQLTKEEAASLGVR